jgi:hypothetical protein
MMVFAIPFEEVGGEEGEGEDMVVPDRKELLLLLPHCSSCRVVDSRAGFRMTSSNKKKCQITYEI